MSRWGTLCSLFGVLMFVTGCPPIAPCTTDADCADDGLFCTTAAVCTEGVCVVGESPCDEGVACDEDNDVCLPPCVDDAECDDGVFCNGAETCGEDGECAAGTDPCMEGQQCDEDFDVCVDACTEDADCADDGDDCTDEVCVEGFCDFEFNTADCDDGDLCTTDDVCADGVCAGTAVDCADDGLFCTGVEACDPDTGDCVASGDPCGLDEACDDDLDECVSGLACTVDADCADDGLFCTGVESCSDALVCVSAGNPCTDVQTCSEDLNECVDPVGDTLDFTLGVDALSGTGGDDTFMGNLLFNAPTGTSVPSLQTGDTANGGDATDTLHAQFNFGAVTTVSPTLTGIENLNFTDFGTAATTLAGVALTGVTDINIANSTNTNVLTVTNLPNGVNVGLAQQAIGATIGFATAATAGATDATTVTFNGLTAGTLTLTTGTTNGFETLNIAANTAATTVADIAMNGTTLTTVNVSGDANFTHTASLDTNVTTVDASTATGNVILTQNNAGAFTYTGGAGDDTIILGANYGTTDILDGGAGTDTLGGTTAVLAGTAAIQTNVDNFEALRVSNELAGAIDLAHFGTITQVVLDDGCNGGSVTNANTGFAISAGLLGGAVCNGGGTQAVTIIGSATTDSATYTLNDCEQTGAVTFNGAETLNLVSNLDLDGSAADSGTAGQNTFAAALVMTDTAAEEKLVITGTEALTITGAITADQIDASGFTEPLVMGVDTTTVGVIITGGSGADTLFGSSGADIIDGGAGADIIDSGDGNDIITGGAGADTFRFVAADQAATPASAVFSTITDFDSDSDIFDDTGAALTIVSGTTGFGIAVASISAEGFCTFNAADDTLQERIVAAEAGIAANGVAAAGQYAIFTHSTHTYLFVSEGTDGLDAGDLLFQLSGVSGLSDSTLTGGNLTIK